MDFINGLSLFDNEEEALKWYVKRGEILNEDISDIEVDEVSKINTATNMLYLMGEMAGIPGREYILSYINGLKIREYVTELYIPIIGEYLYRSGIRSHTIDIHLSPLVSEISFRIQELNEAQNIEIDISDFIDNDELMTTMTRPDENPEEFANIIQNLSSRILDSIDNHNENVGVFDPAVGKLMAIHQKILRYAVKNTADIFLVLENPNKEGVSSTDKSFTQYHDLVEALLPHFKDKSDEIKKRKKFYVRLFPNSLSKLNDLVSSIFSTL